MIEVIVGLLFGAFCYWRGVVSGYNTSLREELAEVLSLIPLNIVIRENDGAFYAYEMVSDLFIFQAKSRDELISELQEKYPNKQIVVSSDETF